MKKIILSAALACALIGSASAETLNTVTDLETDSALSNVTVTYKESSDETTGINTSTTTITASEDDEDGYLDCDGVGTTNDTKIQTAYSVSFVLNLSDMADVLNTAGFTGMDILYMTHEKVNTVAVADSRSASTLGLYLTTDGIAITTADGSTTQRVSFSYTLTAEDGTETTVGLFSTDEDGNYVVNTDIGTIYQDENGDYCIALTWVQHDATLSDGATIYDSDGTEVITDAKLGSTLNNALSSIVISSAFVTSVSIDTEELTADEAASAASALIVPEPTTATLSLLALAGLAARRRRK